MTTLKTVLLLLFFSLYFYRLGAGNIEGLIYYPFWLDMGQMMSNADFITLRSDHLWKVFPLLVAPIVVLLIVTVVLSAIGAAPVPRWVFIGALAFQLIGVASTALIQLPIQFQLNSSGFDPALIEQLIASDLMLRKLPSYLEGLLVVTGLWSVLRSRSQT